MEFTGAEGCAEGELLFAGVLDWLPRLDEQPEGKNIQAKRIGAIRLERRLRPMEIVDFMLQVPGDVCQLVEKQ